MDFRVLAVGDVCGTSGLQLLSRELLSFSIILISRPFYGIVVDIRPDFPVIRIPTDHMVVKPLLPNAFSQMDRNRTLELLYDSGNAWRFFQAVRDYKNKMDMVRHYNIFIHCCARIMVRDCENCLFDCSTD